MALNAYSVCPLGSGKKIKFCCPREHLADYLKVFELMEAEQFAAAASLADRLVEKVPDQVCFLGLKATFADPMDEATFRDVTERLTKSSPDHPITYAAQAQLALLNGELHDVLGFIQDSLERLENAVPQLLLSVMANLANVAYEENHWQMAIALNHFVLALTKFRHSFSLELLQELAMNDFIPPPFKDQLTRRLRLGYPDRCDERIYQLSEGGRWRMARDEVAKLVEQEPDNPWAVGMLAVLSGNLGDLETSHREYQRLAKMPGVPLYLAADAQIIAYSLQETQLSPVESNIPRVKWTFRVRDLDRLTEQLLSDPRVIVKPPHPDDPRAEGAPIPKFLLTFAEFPVPRDAEGLGVRDFPLSIAHGQLFGRQPDREPWLEIYATLHPDRKTRDVVVEQLGEYVEGPLDEESSFGLSRLDNMFRCLILTPDDIAPSLRLELTREAVENVILNRWFEQPHPYLEGKTPQEVANHPDYQVPLTAALLMLQSRSLFAVWEGDYEACWQRLGLPGPLRPSSLDDVIRAGLSSLLHSDLQDVSDADITTLYVWVNRSNLIRALRKIAEIIVQRPGLRSAMDLNPIFEQLCEFGWSPRKHLQYCEEARDWCLETKQPAGMWILRGVTPKLNLGDFEGVRQDLETLMQKHLEEPGVVENLQQLLSMLGLVDADGRPAGGPRQLGSPTAAAGSEASSGLWTPDQPTAEPSASAPSKLWIPGAD